MIGQNDTEKGREGRSLWEAKINRSVRDLTENVVFKKVNEPIQETSERFFLSTIKQASTADYNLLILFFFAFFMYIYLKHEQNAFVQ